MNPFNHRRRRARPVTTILLLCCLGLLFPAPAKANDAAPAPSLQERKVKHRRPTSVPFPKDNDYSPARAELGKALFFDPRLSGSKAISCASCHNPAFSWGDGLPKGVGHGSKQLGRRTPTILNVAWGELYFWDGRADSACVSSRGSSERR